MDLGTFSVSLAVSDIEASQAFYSELGFEAIGGDGQGWVILRNDQHVIGLFSGMFDSNIMTFNPGWSGPGEAASEFTDIRQIRAAVAAAGIGIEADTTSEASEGPASFMVTDPDGNKILFDQHI